MVNKAVVVIPIHSPNPSYNELLSFKQCFSILGNHPIKVLTPIGLNLTVYKSVVADFETIFINPKWQSSVLNYNKLKLSNFFYNLFENYEYLLTYELDAFVFKDKLEYWCNKGYDYIGAPWFENYSETGDKIIGVGNSGFSLRKISSVKNALSKIHYKDPSKFEVGKIKLMKAILNYPLGWLIDIFYKSENYTIQSSSYLYEDRVICDLMPIKIKPFKIAPVEDAIKFSFELRPEILFQHNNNELPMGCHGWEKYNFKFWKPYIESFGYFL